MEIKILSNFYYLKNLKETQSQQLYFARKVKSYEILRTKIQKVYSHSRLVSQEIKLESKSQKYSKLSKKSQNCVQTLGRKLCLFPKTSIAGSRDTETNKDSSTFVTAPSSIYPGLRHKSEFKIFKN